MIISPVLVCQGFQKGFIEPGSMFSVSATMRRGTCENLLRHARRLDWTVIHTFLGPDLMQGADEATIPGFSPTPTEPWSRQAHPSAFGPSSLSPFEKSLFPHSLSPVFLMSFAGLHAITATLMAGLAKGYSMHVVTDAVADTAANGPSERAAIEAAETLARSCKCAVTSGELSTLTPAAALLPRAENRPHLLSHSGS